MDVAQEDVMKLLFSVVTFQKNSGGGKGAEFAAEYLEETCVFDKYLGIFLDCM